MINLIPREVVAAVSLAVIGALFAGAAVSVCQAQTSCTVDSDCAEGEFCCDACGCGGTGACLVDGSDGWSI